VIAPDDRGFTLGDGLFETLLSVDGRLRDTDAHLDRMAAGCQVLGLPDLDSARAETVLAAAGAGPGRWAVRLTLTAGSGGRGLDRPPGVEPLLIATAAPSPRPSEPARLITAQVRRNDRSPAARLKTLSFLDNVLARAEATEAGVDEALMLNTGDQIACAAAANLFWITGGELFTPALTCGALAGVTRAQVIAKAGIPFRLQVPHKAFHRNIGALAGIKMSPEGRVVNEAEWAAKQNEWLPSAEDRAFVASLMGRVVEPGKFAGWIAPPVMGINRQPVDFEYVRFG